MLSWQRINHVTLPDDMRQFYTTHDGASLLWRCTYNSKSHPLLINKYNYVYLSLGDPIGKVVINKLNELKVTSLHHITSSFKLSDKWTPLSSPGSCVVIFTQCTSCGYTCLAYEGIYAPLSILYMRYIHPSLYYMRFLSLQCDIVTYMHPSLYMRYTHLFLCTHRFLYFQRGVAY